MSEQIKVGDLVQVVKWPCCGSHLGRIFKVGAMWNGVSDVNGCWQCSFIQSAGSPVIAGEGSRDSDGFRAKIEYLKRIPPLDELERVSEREELTA